MQLVRILVREVDGLAEVICDVIQLPFVAVDHIDPFELGLDPPRRPPYGGVVQASQPS